MVERIPCQVKQFSECPVSKSNTRKCRINHRRTCAIRHSSTGIVLCLVTPATGRVGAAVVVRKWLDAELVAGVTGHGTVDGLVVTAVHKAVFWRLQLAAHCKYTYIKNTIVLILCAQIVHSMPHFLTDCSVYWRQYVYLIIKLNDYN